MCMRKKFSPCPSTADITRDPRIQSEGSSKEAPPGDQIVRRCLQADMLRGSRLVALVAAACCCTVSDALLLGPHPPCHRHVAAASTAGRARTLRCEEASPQEVEAVKNIPPEMLAAAWEREEEAKELSALLKGCQVLCRTACMHGGDMRASAMHMR